VLFLSEQRKSVIVRCSIERPLSFAHLVLLDHNKQYFTIDNQWRDEVLFYNQVKFCRNN